MPGTWRLFADDEGISHVEKIAGDTAWAHGLSAPLPAALTPPLSL